MRILPAAGRAALPLVVATLAVGLVSAPAWASTGSPATAGSAVLRNGPPGPHPGSPLGPHPHRSGPPPPPRFRPPPPPPPVGAQQCRHDGGHVVRNGDPRFTCIGGRWNGRPVRF